jgi:diacylglycerol kinase (ATP)
VKSTKLKLLFIINPGSGNGEVNFKQEIATFFESRTEEIELYELPKSCNIKKLKAEISKSKADRVVAVGGDGIHRLALFQQDRPMGWQKS